MSKEKNGKWRPLLNLWPAGLAGLLVACALSAMSPEVAAIPELLEYEAPEETTAAIPKLKNLADLTSKKKEKKEKKAESKSEAFTDPSSYKDGVYTGSAQGFGGAITVQVTVQGGKIVSVDVLNATGETASYFSSALSVVDSIVNAGTPNVDIVSGATYSSNGIINAVKRALSGAGGNAEDFSVTELQPVVDTTPVILPSISIDPNSIINNPGNKYKDGIYTGSAYGFGGPVVMQVKISGGKIVAADVLSANGETGSYFNRAQSIISSILMKQSTDVDVISGATFSSEGILEAVAQALSEAVVKESDEPDDMDADSEADGDVESDDSDNGEKDQDREEPVIESPYSDGLFWGSAICTDGDELEDSLFWYTINFHITIENGEVVSVSADTSDDLSEEPEENEKYFLFAAEGRTRKGQWYEGIINQVLDKQGADELDIVSSATYSSKAMIRAAKEAFSVALKKAEVTDETID